MGDLIYLSRRRGESAVTTEDSLRPQQAGIRFYLALDCPLSYLAAERIERALGEVAWVPVMGPLSEPDGPASCADRGARTIATMRQAERESRLLRIPLVWPKRFPSDSRRAARAATLAAELGAGQRFSLAIARLAFCGGFDISKQPVIREAARVAGLDANDAAAAAEDRSFDRWLDQTSLGLLARGVGRPPAISIGEQIFDGPDAVVAAASFRAEQARTELASDEPRTAPLD